MDKSILYTWNVHRKEKKMQEFNFVVKRTIFIPESIKVKGKEYPVSVDEDEYTTDEGRYYPPTIEYGGDLPVAIPDTNGEPRWFTLRLEYQKDKEKFYAVLELDGRTIVTENFFAENDIACLVIDRFVETLEECL